MILKIGNFFFRFRNMVFPSIFIVAFLLLSPAMFLKNPSIDRLIIIFGVMLSLLGCILRLSVIGFAYIVRGGKNKRIYADGLVNSGFYAHCRNPMYVGNILIAAGISLIYGSAFMIFGILPFFIFVYLAITAAEEEYLQNKFGWDPLESTCRHASLSIL